MMFSINAHSQIIYTDVYPDQTFNTNGNVYHLDLNNDGITDFNISKFYSITCFTYNCNKKRILSSIRISPLNGNAVAANTIGPLKMHKNEDVSSATSCD